jgi:4-hydroxybenzoate polyprenyltransferase/phosphoserine phosphatase
MTDAQPLAKILAVDLDGTLIKSDMLHETFWDAASKDWGSAIGAVRTIVRGQAALKQELAQASDVDVTTLPYNAIVINYIKAWKANGGRVLLVTATDQSIANKIAEHLGLFDAVHGSDGTRNLKGPNKAEFLAKTFGVGGFAYMGDVDADLHVWRVANRAISVNAPNNLRARIEALGVEVEHLGPAARARKPYVKALRPHQWIKNVLVLAPMLLAHNWELASFITALWGFVAFCLTASAVYVINDLLDLKADREHPRKRFRPFAAGAAPIRQGSAIAASLLIASTIISLIVGPAFLLVLLVYFATTTAYSFYFKRRIIIDICVLAGLYTIRILAGSIAVSAPISLWLLAFSMFFFFALAAIKRQAELIVSAKAGKLSPTGRGYHTSDLEVISQMAIASGYVSVLVLALYVNFLTTLSLYAHPSILWGTCLILLFWVSWVAILTHRGEMHDDPIVFAVKDRVSQLCAGLMLCCTIGGVLL